VGHETDVTLADLVADLRAPTPSAAAEIVAPECGQIARAVEAAGGRLARALARRARQARAELQSLLARPGLRRPERLLAEPTQQVDEATRRMADAMRVCRQGYQSRLAALGAKLEALGPDGVLARGYSIARRAADGAVVTSWTQVSPGDPVELTLQSGSLRARTESVAPPAQEAGP
jgi:exodeoxyribonuclease VII large subunit